MSYYLLDRNSRVDLTYLFIVYMISIGVVGLTSYNILKTIAAIYGSIVVLYLFMWILFEVDFPFLIKYYGMIPYHVLKDGIMCITKVLDPDYVRKHKLEELRREEELKKISDTFMIRVATTEEIMDRITFKN